MTLLRLIIGLLLATCLFLTGCGPDTYSIRMTTAENMNNNSATIIMMVSAYNEAAFKKLQKIKVPEWFAKYQEILNASPGDYSAFKWELVPGQIVYVQRPKTELEDVVGIMFLADFTKPKAAKAAIKEIEDQIEVKVGQNTISAIARDSGDEGRAPPKKGEKKGGDEKPSSGMISGLSKDAPTGGSSSSGSSMPHLPSLGGGSSGGSSSAGSGGLSLPKF